MRKNRKKNWSKVIADKAHPLSIAAYYVRKDENAKKWLFMLLWKKKLEQNKIKQARDKVDITTYFIMSS